MERDELLRRLAELAESSDSEEAHYKADRDLLAFIGDEEITAAYDAITPKWYA